MCIKCIFFHILQVKFELLPEQYNFSKNLYIIKAYIFLLTINIFCPRLTIQFVWLVTVWIATDLLHQSGKPTTDRRAADWETGICQQSCVSNWGHPKPPRTITSQLYTEYINISEIERIRTQGQPMNENLCVK